MSNKAIKTTVVILFMVYFIFYAHTAYAGVSIEVYKQKMKEASSKQAIEIYMQGIAYGIGIANAELEHQNRPLLYCQPENLGLSNSDFIRILDDKINSVEQLMQKRPDTEKQKFLNDMEGLVIEALLMMGLQEKFPCKEK